jgi:hypothetical protein
MVDPGFRISTPAQTVHSTHSIFLTLVGNSAGQPGWRIHYWYVMQATAVDPPLAAAPLHAGASIAQDFPQGGAPEESKNDH